MRVYESSNLVTLGIPKTGTTSIRLMMGKLESYSPGESHITPQMLKDQDTDEYAKLRNFRKVTFVREPMSRFSSGVAQYLTTFNKSFVLSSNFSDMFSSRHTKSRHRDLIFEILERIQDGEDLNPDSDLQHFRLQAEYLKPKSWAANTKKIQMGQTSILKDYLIRDAGLSESALSNPQILNKRSSRPPTLGLAKRYKIFKKLHQVIPESYLGWYGKPFNLMHAKTMNGITEEIHKEPFIRFWKKVFEPDIELWNNLIE